MNRIVIHTPMNHRNALIEGLKQHLKEFHKKHGLETTIETPSHNYSKNWLLEYLERNSSPDMIITHASDLAVLSSEKIAEIFAPFRNRFQLSTELEQQGFREPGGFLHPFALVPYVIICNTDMIEQENRPVKWEELFQPQWNNMITFPDAGTPISQIVLSFLYDYAPEKFQEFYPAVKFQSSVVEALKAVREGQYPLGIANIGFAKIMAQKNVVPIWPQDGAVCIPQIMAWSRQADPRLLELGDFMLSQPIQALFARQGFIPVNPTLPQQPHENGKCKLLWEGWDRYWEVTRKGYQLL